MAGADFAVPTIASRPTAQTPIQLPRETRPTLPPPPPAKRRAAERALNFSGRPLARRLASAQGAPLAGFG